MKSWKWLGMSCFIGFVIICGGVVIWGILKQNIIVQIISALFGVAGLILAFFQVFPFPVMTSKQRTISISIIGTAILLGATVVSLGLFSKVGGEDNPVRVPTPQPSATNTIGTSGTSTPDSTPLNPSPSPSQTQVLATGLETPSLPIPLGCQCDDPVTVNITAVEIQQQRMIWSLTLTNISPNNANSYFLWFRIREGDQINYPTDGQPYYASGRVVDQSVSLAPQKSAPATLIFVFRPQANTPYTLESKLGVNLGTYVPFDSVLIQFK